jgi:hypothetical protein
MGIIHIVTPTHKTYSTITEKMENIMKILKLYQNWCNFVVHIKWDYSFEWFY